MDFFFLAEFYDTFQIMQNEIDEELISTIKKTSSLHSFFQILLDVVSSELSKERFQSNAINNIHRLYQSCINEEAIEKGMHLSGQ